MKYCDITKDKTLHAQMVAKSKVAHTSTRGTQGIDVISGRLDKGIHKRPSTAAKKTKKTSSTVQANIVSYQIRFYFLITLLLVSTVLYIRHQALNVPNSVFSTMYQLISIQIKKSREELIPAISKSKETETPRPPVNTRTNKKTSSKVNKKTYNPIDNNKVTTKATSTVPSIFTLYYSKLDKRNNAVELVGIPITIQQSKIKAIATNQTTLYYHSIIQAILHQVNTSTKFIKPFQEKVFLKKAWIEDDVLLLDFNQSFTSSRYGDKGIVLQIQQIIWTLFNLQNPPGQFNFISFLIEGKRYNKLGGHGLPIKVFYSKKDLRRNIYAKKKSS